MVLAAKLGLQSVQCDITAAFIHGYIHPEEEIYVHQPHGSNKVMVTSALRLANSLWAPSVTTLFLQVFH